MQVEEKVRNHYKREERGETRQKQKPHEGSLGKWVVAREYPRNYLGRQNQKGKAVELEVKGKEKKFHRGGARKRSGGKRTRYWAQVNREEDSI